MKILPKHPELYKPVLNLTYNGSTPLLNACEKNGEIAKYLLQCGADWRIKDQKGKTAIYYAAKNNFPDVVEEIFTMCKSFLVYSGLLDIITRQT
jgi:ankyrin repeat protein